MTTLSVSPPFPLITDIDGQPLEDGYIWIGVANLPPIGNPIAVYWDAALTIPAALPVRTRGGYPVNAGTPARLYVGSDYSILVQNKNGSAIYSAPDGASDRFSSAQISFLQAGLGAVVRTAQSKMRDVVSVKDFGAVGDGLADDTLAIQAALDAADVIFFPQGEYVLATDQSGTGSITNSYCLKLSSGNKVLYGEKNSILRNDIPNTANTLLLADTSVTNNDITISGLHFKTTVINADFNRRIIYSKGNHTNVKITDCDFSDFTLWGIVFDTVSTVNNLVISDCKMFGCRSTSIAVRGDADSVLILDNVIDGESIATAFPSSYIDDRIAVFPHDNTKVARNVIIANNVVKYSDTCGIKIANSDNVVIKGNVIEYCRSAIQIRCDTADNGDRGNNNVVIQANLISNVRLTSVLAFNNDCIWATGTDQLTIVDNHISFSGANADIGASSVINTITGTGGKNSTNVVIKNNNIFVDGSAQTIGADYNYLVSLYDYASVFEGNNVTIGTNLAAGRYDNMLYVIGNMCSVLNNTFNVNYYDLDNSVIYLYPSGTGYVQYGTIIKDNLINMNRGDVQFGILAYCSLRDVVIENNQSIDAGSLTTGSHSNYLVYLANPTAFLQTVFGYPTSTYTTMSLKNNTCRKIRSTATVTNYPLSVINTAYAYLYNNLGVNPLWYKGSVTVSNTSYAALKYNDNTNLSLATLEGASAYPFLVIASTAVTGGTYDAASMYLIHINSTGANITTIHEGTYTSAPRVFLDVDNVVKVRLNTAVASIPVRTLVVSNFTYS